MRRSQRVSDNPALETAIAIANEVRLPLLVFFCLRDLPDTSIRTISFMVDGLRETAESLENRSVGFVLRHARGRASDELGRLCDEVHPSAVVTDENALGGIDGWKRLVPADFRLPLVTVDADVIVPSALLPKEHFAARTIRPKIHQQLDRFLRPVEKYRVQVRWERDVAGLLPEATLLNRLTLDRSIGVTHFKGGTANGMLDLKSFLKGRLDGYAIRRNHPEVDGTSQLSPYIHFGQLGPHTIALAVRDADAPEADREAFLEEFIVRRELAINFVRFNRHYKSLVSCEPWALRTLREHADDPRPYRYSERQFENAETHDALWNAAQRQMVRSGWMHGYVRMYWAKKILEWSPSAEAAYEIAVRLNDCYELDGRDANGYAGIAWAIGGKHDRAWGPERPIYGKIRYMSASSTGRKFDSRSYIARWRE